MSKAKYKFSNFLLSKQKAKKETTPIFQLPKMCYLKATLYFMAI
uniref:Uncharacterized protein n=1 Tax=Anguilla anguilla TaxID=7936 RepID=A0A0E9TWE5_ANGAN